MDQTKYFEVEELISILDKININKLNNEIIPQFNFDKIEFQFWTDRPITLIDVKYSDMSLCYHQNEVTHCRYKNKLVAEQFIKKFKEDKNYYQLFISYL
jgi:DNA-directed RNA polymerase alpha subunit